MTLHVIEIVELYLVSNGFSGLVQEDADCGCELSDLAPCGDMGMSCSAGYKHMRPNCKTSDWVITESQIPPTEWSDDI